MLNFIKQLLDWLYHENCYFCHKNANDSLICDKCYNSIDINDYYQIKKIYNIKVFSATKYENKIKKLIRALKYHDKKKLAFPMANLMYKYWQKLEFDNIDYEIVPVPLFYKRQKQRKYNHVTLIADELSKLTGYTINEKIITRVKNTKPQYKLSKIEREKNLENAFEVDLNYYHGKPLLIIDDICSSGATVKEIINTLKNYNIDKMSVLVGANPNFKKREDI